jgi:hypothetical protein
MKSFNTPIAVFAYRRHDTLAKVLQQILLQNPVKLYVFINAPATEEEIPLVEKVHKTVIEMVPESCNLILKQQQQHVGLGMQFNVSLKYLFEQEEQALIFEDDTVPAALFFEFAQQMLQRYKQDETVMNISGCNLNAFEPTNEAGYVLSPFALPCWGWATWARAWKKYDFYMKGWADKRELIKPALGTYAVFFIPMFDKYSKVLRVWDMQWNSSIWQNNGSTLLPTQNLVTNIGFTPYGTFSAFSNSAFANLKLETENYNGTFTLFNDTKRVAQHADALISLINEINSVKTLQKPAGNYTNGN